MFDCLRNQSGKVDCNLSYSDFQSFMVKNRSQTFSVGNSTNTFFSMDNSVLYRKRQKRDEFIASLLKLFQFSHDLLVSIKSCFKQISVLMLGSLSRWLSIMVVAARRWDEKFYRFCPIFQLIWDQSISLGNTFFSVDFWKKKTPRFFRWNKSLKFDFL